MECPECGEVHVIAESVDRFNEGIRYCPYCGSWLKGAAGLETDAGAIIRLLDQAEVRKVLTGIKPDIRNLWSTPEERAEYDNPFSAQETAFMQKLVRQEIEARLMRVVEAAEKRQ